MKIELRKLKISLAHSEETTLFNAELYIDGVKAGYTKNDGRGGNTSYMPCEPYEKTKELIKQAEAFCLTLPKRYIYDFPTVGEDDSYDVNLENFIDDLVYEAVNQKEKERFAKAMQKHMLNSICYGVPDSGEYRTLKFKHSIAVIKEKAPHILAQHVADIKAKLKDGEVIFNTNL